MSSAIDKHWKQLDFMAIQQPQRFLAEFEDYSRQYPGPSEQRQLNYLKAKALHTMQDSEAAMALVFNLLEEAIETNDLHSNLAGCYRNLGQIEQVWERLELAVPRIESSFVRRLQDYRFPGNIRELKNIIERLLIMQSGTVWDYRTLSKLPSLNLENKPEPGKDIRLRQALLEKEEIIEALQKCQGKQKDAARLLGISESTLTRRISAYKLEIYTRKGK